MERLGDTLTNQGYQVEPRPNLVSLQSLPPSRSIRLLVQDLELRLLKEENHRIKRNLRNEIAYAERRLALGEQRDAIQATRPDGCWCLGAGGAKQSTVNDGTDGNDMVVIYLETCVCPDGLAWSAYREKEMPSARNRAIGLERIGAWERSGIPRRFSLFRLEEWPSAMDYPQVLECFTPSWDSIMITGPYGRGKTGLAIGYAWACLQALGVKSIRFIAMPQLFAELRDTYNREEGPTEAQVVGRYAACDLLILDDIGAEQVRNTEWVEDRLYQVIGSRHAEMRPTIFTSNLSLDQLAGRLGERVTWRIAEMVADNIVDLSGLPNLRA